MKLSKLRGTADDFARTRVIGGGHSDFYRGAVKFVE